MRRPRVANHTVRAYHEGGHAVIARKLGMQVLFVTIIASDPRTVIVPALDRAELAGRTVQPQDFENDAINALAGLAANRRAHPHKLPLSLPSDWPDIADARRCVLQMIFLRTGQPLPESGTKVPLDPAATREFRAEYARIEQQTTSLVAKHWRAIERVVKHLERHVHIKDQAMLDDLIERAERHADR
jgi:hypothetical protein